MKNELILIKVPKIAIYFTSWFFALSGLVNSRLSYDLHLEIYMFCSIMIMVSYVKEAKEINNLPKNELRLSEGEGLLRYNFQNKWNALMIFFRWLFMLAFAIALYFDLVINKII